MDSTHLPPLRSPAGAPPPQPPPPPPPSARQQTDFTNRDPNNLNDHLKVCFEDVLAEPEGAHSIDCVWANSYRCFECSKNVCYRLMTTLCGICIAFGWGCDFAMIAFNHVWFWTPCMRDFAICVGCFQKVFGTLISCCCAPVCEAMGLILSRIRVQKG